MGFRDCIYCWEYPCVCSEEEKRERKEKEEVARREANRLRLLKTEAEKRWEAGMDVFGNDNYPLNENHNPSRRLENMKPAPRCYIVWKPKTPDAREVRGIIRPGSAVWEPNCAKVVAAGDGCELAKPGDYVFWSMFGRVDRETGEIDHGNKPSPVVWGFTDEEPAFYTIHERDVVAVTKSGAEDERLSEL